MAKQTIAQLNNKIDELTPTVKEMYKMLVVSNGEISVVERLRKIEGYIIADEERRKIATDDRKAYTKMFIAIGASNVFVWLATFFYWVLKIVPELNSLVK